MNISVDNYFDSERDEFRPNEFTFSARRNMLFTILIFRIRVDAGEADAMLNARLRSAFYAFCFFDGLMAARP